MKPQDLLNLWNTYIETQSVDSSKIDLYLVLLAHLKPTIARSQDAWQDPPETTLRSVELFICEALQISVIQAKALWEGLRENIWHCKQRPAGEAELILFLKHGLHDNLDLGAYTSSSTWACPYLQHIPAFFHLYPPSHTCLHCREQPRGARDIGIVNEHATNPEDDLTVPVTIFTLEYGAIPGFATSYLCRREACRPG
jgi:hypothetical protein